jgi:uncharacterized protein YgbK (DUF1537 family)
MTMTRPTSPAPAITGATTLEALLAGKPPVRAADPAVLREKVRAGHRLVVLDDDPTGTQSVAQLPVLTTWSVEDLRWALRQETAGFFVLTNTRSLSEADAVERNQQIVRALVAAARQEGVGFAIASRSDSTLRGYFPLETDVLTRELASFDVTIDGVIIVPALLEPGRVTIDSVHWMKTPAGMIPVSHSEFAKDASFGYFQSDLRDWVQEKTAGRVSRDHVATVTLHDLRSGGPTAVCAILRRLTDAQPVVVDAVVDDDLRILVDAILQAERAGKRFLYRTGPSFVRARSGQVSTPPLDAAALADIVAGSPDRGPHSLPTSACGLIAIGSHVGLTTRQLDRLRAGSPIVELELDVAKLLDGATRDRHVQDITKRAAAHMANTGETADVVIRTSRQLVTGTDAADSLVIARTVSAALVKAVHDVVATVRPKFVVAKGGITSSDVATVGLEITRAWSRGTLLPGMVSLWEPISGLAQSIPYIVFAGNVGSDDALLEVVTALRAADAATLRGKERSAALSARR